MNSQLNVSNEIVALCDEIKALRSELSSIKNILRNQEAIENGPSDSSNKDSTKNKRPLRSEELDHQICKILLSYKIKANIKGYTYLREAIGMVHNNMSLKNNITKGLYSEIATKFRDTPACVERAIRHAIESAWYSADSQSLIRDNLGLNSKPKNSEFIALIVEYIRLADN